MSLTIKEALKKSKNTIISLPMGADKQIQQMLGDDEEVFYALTSNVKIDADVQNAFSKRNSAFGGAGSIKGKLSGVVVITNQRVIFCNVLPFKISEKEIPLSEIQSIDGNIGMLGTGQLRIVGITEMFVVDIYSNRVMTEVKKAISEAKAYSAKKGSPISPTFSAADELMKWKKLMDEGVISKDEFEAKKKELL